MSEHEFDFDGTINFANLQDWVVGQSGLPGSGPLTGITELQGGSQNLIFRLERGGESMVLRRPPKHPRPGADATMVREATVLTALKGTAVPHAEIYGLCAETEVLGTAFYVMALVDGFVPRGELPGQYGTDKSWRRSMAEGLISGAAQLGRIDPYAVGLEGLGKPEGWAERQVARWKSQLDGYAELDGYDGPDLPGFEAVADWLDTHTPSDYVIGLNHGDCQWANAMFAYDSPRLAAFVDWEMSTLGDPLLDLGWILTSWVDPRDPEGHGLPVTPWDGFPTRAEVVARYVEEAGRDIAEVPWFFVLACYKLGVVLEGSWARALAGKIPMEMGKALHDYATWLFAKARQLITEGPDW